MPRHLHALLQKAVVFIALRIRCESVHAWLVQLGGQEFAQTCTGGAVFGYRVTD